MSSVRHILSLKGTHVFTISEQASVLAAVQKMHKHGIGCLVVTSEGGAVSGILSGRAVLNRIANVESDLSSVAVREIMNSQVIVCHAADELSTIRATMKTQYVRQIPVVDKDGALEGLISIGDVNAYLVDEDEVELRYLHDYIEGRVR